MTNKGFTFIEILVVVIIIGIASTFAFLAVGDFGTHRKARIEAEHFVSFVKMIQQQAILEINSYGIKIENHGYGAFKLEKDNLWVPLSGSNLRWHALAPNISLFFVKHSLVKSKEPQIMIHSTGEMTGFDLYFGTNSKPQQVHLHGKHNGDIMTVSDSK